MANSVDWTTNRKPEYKTTASGSCLPVLFTGRNRYVWKVESRILFHVSCPSLSFNFVVSNCKIEEDRALLVLTQTNRTCERQGDRVASNISGSSFSG